MPKQLLGLVGDWTAFFKASPLYGVDEIESHERTGRPLGDIRFIEKAGKLLGRV